MIGTGDPLARIAEALERMAPRPPALPDGNAAAWRWDGATLSPLPILAALPIDLLCGIDAQKAALLTNSERLAAGAAAYDALLWGARGSGKSALVKSVVAEVQRAGGALTLVELPASEFASLPRLFAQITHWTQAAIIFIDDLAFESAGAGARMLRSVLEGGTVARPPQVRLYVTSNRRHIVPRSLDEQASAINPRDVVDDNLALADRFGLSLGFHACDQETWLAMVRGYAARLGVGFDEHDALTWATQRGARSGRVAWHYAVEWAGRAGLPLTAEQLR